MSHNQTMDKKNGQETPTKDSAQTGLVISHADAEEFRAYKRQKRVGEVMRAISRSISPIGVKDDAVRVTEKAIKFRQAAVKVTPAKLMQSRDYFLKSRVPIDVIVGGDGETLPKVKAYEAKAVKKLGAKEITVIVTPSLVASGRYVEVKRELKKIARAAKGMNLKVWIDKRYPFSTIARVARISAEVGAKYFCLPYFAGCERLRYDLAFGCLLEISEVETLEQFKKMAIAGMGRIVTSAISEIHAEWLREIETENVLAQYSDVVTPQKSLLEDKKEKSDGFFDKTKEKNAVTPPFKGESLEKEERLQEQKRIEGMKTEQATTQTRGSSLKISDFKFL